MKGLDRDTLTPIIVLFHIHLSSKPTDAIKYNGPVYKSSYWRYRNASWTLYGLDYYMGTRLYRNNPNKQPSICFNAYDLKEGKYGYFICPPPTKHISFTACCGQQDKEDCCRPPAPPGGFALIFGFVIGLVVVCGLGCYFCIKHGEQCCRQIGHCCSSMAKCVDGLCNSLGSIGNCCRQKKRSTGGPSEVEAPETDNIHPTETLANKPSVESGNTQPETQLMNVRPTKTETRSTYRVPPVYVHRTRPKTRSPYRPTTRSHYSARLDHSDLGDSDSD